MNESTTLAEGLQRTFMRNGDRTALVIGDQHWRYAELAEEAGRLAQTLLDVSDSESPFVGVFAYRSVVAYVAVQATLLAGKAYMPLHPRFPADRTHRMVRHSNCEVIIADAEALAPLTKMLTLTTRSLTIIFPYEVGGAGELPKQFPQHHFLFPDAISKASTSFGSDASPEAPAYLLYTSGSTGEPKGVAVINSNVCEYVHYTIARYGTTTDDRFSQMFDLTFDLSVHDMFVSWFSGATLFVVPEKSVMAPAKFIRDRALTMWFSVPSVAMFMARMRMLKPGAFPSLRYSLFCGEALPITAATNWQAAAPNSVVENLYGPTEATIAITNYRWNPESSPAECRNDLVPIGTAFTNQMTRIVDEQLLPVGPDQTGELCLAGSQLTPGYLNDLERTADRYIQLPQSPLRWYRTGDLVTRDSTGCIHYLGRTDSQIQILGHRVEIAEIDASLRHAAETDSAVCVAWPIDQGRSDGVYAFVVGSEDEERRRSIIEQCRLKLPDYMVPRKLFFVNELPLNANGKIDRQKLQLHVQHYVATKTS